MKHPSNTLSPDTGQIQCDGYSAYQTIANNFTDIALGSCLAHIRRKFTDDESLLTYDWGPGLIADIQTLYKIEEDLRKANAPPDQKEKIRQSKARPLLDKIYQTFTDQSSKLRPQDPAMKAINYGLGQWDGILLYLNEGKLDIDNNGVENAVRPTKLGRKNWLFFGSLGAGQKNADLFTLIQNCKTLGLNPRRYLEDTILAMKTLKPADLTPEAYSKALQDIKEKAA